MQHCIRDIKRLFDSANSDKVGEKLDTLEALTRSLAILKTHFEPPSPTTTAIPIPSTSYACPDDHSRLLLSHAEILTYSKDIPIDNEVNSVSLRYCTR